MNTRFRLVNSLRNRFWQWVVRRAPKAPTVTLQHKSIYIFPGRQGLLFILVLGLMWLLGTNYENNLILAAAFLLLSMMVVSMIHAFRNLSGLRITALGSQPVFAGEYVQFDVLLEAAPRTDHENIQLSFAENVSVAVDGDGKGEFEIEQTAKQFRRGLFPERPLYINSDEQNCLIKAGSWDQRDSMAQAYPVTSPSGAPTKRPTN